MSEKQADYKVPAVIDVTAAVMPINVEAAVARWKAYQKLCVEILTDDDYATISGKKARKRSGWRKLGRFMGVSIEITSEERWERADTFGYTFTVRASTRDGQYQDGDGLCDSTEFTGRIACSEHNVRSKALTRAKNRATADLIGGGEVSAEELDNGDRKPRRKATKKKAASKPANSQGIADNAWATDTQALKGFWAWARAKTLGSDDVHEALGVEHLADYQGHMGQAKTQIIAWIGEQIDQGQQERSDTPAEAAKTAEQHQQEMIGNVEGRQ